ncbi:MAG: hypothetical protein IPJ03_16815 [Ignavibacteriales bacterium]|nr:hypothetical protein [Ignavibacteriales bacterium]
MEIKMVSIADVPTERGNAKYGEIYSKIPSITKGMALGVTLRKKRKLLHCVIRCYLISQAIRLWTNIRLWYGECSVI